MPTPTTAKQVQMAVLKAQDGLQEVLGLVPLLEAKETLEASLGDLEARKTAGEARIKELASLASVSETNRARATEGLDKQVKHLEAQITDLANTKRDLEERNAAVRQDIARDLAEGRLQQAKELDEHRDRIAGLLREEGEAKTTLAKSKEDLRAFHQGLAAHTA